LSCPRSDTVRRAGESITHVAAEASYDRGRSSVPWFSIIYLDISNHISDNVKNISQYYMYTDNCYIQGEAK